MPFDDFLEYFPSTNPAMLPVMPEEPIPPDLKGEELTDWLEDNAPFIPVGRMTLADLQSARIYAVWQATPRLADVVSIEGRIRAAERLEVQLGGNAAEVDS